MVRECSIHTQCKEGTCQYGNGWPLPSSRSPRSLALAVVDGRHRRSRHEGRRRPRRARSRDIGGLNDKGFNAVRTRACKTRKKQLGITARVFISKSVSDYIPNLSTAARQGYDLDHRGGFLMGDDIDEVGEAVPDTKFAIIDFSQRPG